MSQIGPYRLELVLGRGGMGLVYRAQHETTGQRAAVKTVSVRDAARISQIRREVQALAKLAHPGLVRVIEHGVDNGMPWYAMDLLEGRTLGHVAKQLFDGAGSALHLPTHATTLDSRDETAVTAVTGMDNEPSPSSPPPAARRTPIERVRAAGGRLPEVLGLMHGLCETLAYVHGEGVVHRDLKPSNVFVTPSGRPVLVDFGLVAHVGDAGGRDVLDTQTHTAGSARYIAPEQIRGQLLDPRCDLYSLGCVLFELVCGRTPFVGPLHSVLDQHLRRPPPLLSELATDVPAELETLIAGLLEKDRRKRIGHARDVATALSACGAQLRGWDAPLPPERPYLYRPPLVGRRELLDRLDALQRSTFEGHGAIAFIEGESGVGKTRLALESAQRAAQLGARVIGSVCASVEVDSAGQDEGSRSGPLEPLRPFLRSVCDACLEGGERETARLLGTAGPSLASFEPALSQVSAPGPDPLGALPAAAARKRLYQSLLDVLEAYAANQPLLLIIDDLQWADELTLGFLEFLGPRLAQHLPVMVLGVARRDEHSPRLDELRSAAWAHRFELPRLSARELEGMVAGMLSIARAPVEFVGYLSQQSEGNPFFVAEYLRTAVAEGLLTRNARGEWTIAQSTEPTEVMCAALPLPRSLRELVERRIGHLSAQTRSLMLVAATIGRSFDLAVLQAASGVSEVVALDAVAELVQRQVVEPVEDGSGFRFVHDKLREIPIGELTAAERCPLHRMVASALEARGALEREADRAVLGHHFSEALEHARAAIHLDAAGDMAIRVHAIDRAIAHYRATLAALAEVPDPRDAPDVAQVSEKLGDALALRAANQEARDHLSSALERARPDDALTRARLLCKIGKTHEVAHEHDQALAEYGRAESALRNVLHRTEAWRRAWITVQLNRAWVHYWCARVNEMDVVLNGVASEVTQHGTALERCAFYRALVLRDLRAQRFRVSEPVLDNARLALRAGQDASSPVETAAVRFLLGFTLLFGEQLEAAESELSSAMTASRRLGDSTNELRCLAYLTLIRRRHGRVQETRQLAQETLSQAELAGQGDYIGLGKACLAWAAWKQGRPQESERLCREALEVWSTLTFTYPFQWTGALVLFAVKLSGTPSPELLRVAAMLRTRELARLPEAIDRALEQAVSAGEAGESARAAEGLSQAIAAANALGYL